MKTDDYIENVHVLSCFVLLKSVLLISCVFLICCHTPVHGGFYGVFTPFLVITVKFFFHYNSRYLNNVTTNKRTNKKQQQQQQQKKQVQAHCNGSCTLSCRKGGGWSHFNTLYFLLLIKNRQKSDLLTSVLFHHGVPSSLCCLPRK